MSFDTPNLPGFRSNKPYSKNKKQNFKIVGGILVESDSVPSFSKNTSRSMGQSMSQSLIGQDMETPDPESRRINKKPVPKSEAKWVRFAGKVLRFFSFFKEAVNERAEESFRVRDCDIYYYLEDDTIQVVEHKQENSGIPQGTFVKRHKVPRANGFYTLKDLTIGAQLSIYGRTFQVVDCDAKTRTFMEEEMGVSLPEPIPVPADSHTSLRRAHMQRETGADTSIKRNVQKGPMKKFMEASLGNTVNNNGLSGFLKFDRKVLRFECEWDDTESMFGDKLHYTVHYFVADDTLEILEKHTANNGRDPFPYLLRRAKLPRGYSPPDPNGRNDVEGEQNFYHWPDFYIGASIMAFNRDLRVIAADDATRDFYAEQGMPLGPDIAQEEEVPATYQPTIAPYNGFGSEEDSRASCKSLIPKPPRTEFDKKGVNLETKVLRFGARMDTDKYDDRDRRFVVMFYIADDTIAVREPPSRNSGVVGGNFLKRMKVISPSGGPYTQSDFYAGATVIINSKPFIIMDVDEHTLNHMDTNTDIFPLSNKQAVITAIAMIAQQSGAKQTLLSAFAGVERLPAADFGNHLKKVFPDMEDQIIITLMRAFDKDKNGFVTATEFLDVLELDDDDDLSGLDSNQPLSAVIRQSASRGVFKRKNV